MDQAKKWQDAPEFDFIKLLFHCLYKWYWFVLCAAVCVGAAVFYLQHKTKVYSVMATIMIRSDNNLSRSSLQTDMMQLMGYQTSKVIADEIEIIRSHTIIEQAVKELDLQTEYRKKRGMRWEGQYPVPTVSVIYPPSFLDSLFYSISINIERTEADYVIEVKSKGTEVKYHVDNLRYPLQTAAGQLQFVENYHMKVGDKLQIQTLPRASRGNLLLRALIARPAKKDGNVIQIGMESDMPDCAKDIITKVIELYNMDAVIDKNIMATNTANFIDERLKIVEKELNDVEGDVENYMKDNGVTSLSKELSIVLQNQTTFQNDIADVQTQINLLEFLADYLSHEVNNESLIPANFGVKDASLNSLVGDYNNKMLYLMKIKRSVTEVSPLYMQTEEQLATLRNAILVSVDNLKQGLEIKRKDLVKKDRQISSQLHQLPERERRYVEIKRQQEIKEKLYIYLYQKREENALTLASTVMPAKTIDGPILRTQVKPHSKRIILIALLLGLGIPFLCLFLMDYLNDEVKDQREFQSVVKAPFLGHVLYMPSDNVVAVESHNNSAQAELFRTIRTNLRFMLPEKKSPVLLVTSALNGEGKSYVAINIAASLALLKKKVVLVGMDIRKPTISQYLHIDFKGELTSYLLDPTIALDDLIIQSGVVDNLDIMPSGAIPPNPGELIQSPNVEKLFNALKERYDYIVVDTSPLYLVSDTFHLDKYGDMTIFVTRANYISREMLPYIQDIYAGQKMHNMACILNASTGGKRGYGYGRYGYGYGYGRYGYGRYGYGRYGYGGYGYGYYGEKHKES